jgi:hypothetical protein
MVEPGSRGEGSDPTEDRVGHHERKDIGVRLVAVVGNPELSEELPDEVVVPPSMTPCNCTRLTFSIGGRQTSRIKAA